MGCVEHIELFLYLQIFFYSVIRPRMFANWCPSYVRLLPAHRDREIMLPSPWKFRFTRHSSQVLEKDTPWVGNWQETGRKLTYVSKEQRKKCTVVIFLK